jgi:hypothetical protein
MQPITCWWSGIPGIDGNCLPDSATFADRTAAIVIAGRLHRELPPERSSAAAAALKTADSLFDWFQDTETNEEALRLRLAVAMVASTLTPGEKPDISALKRRAKWLADYMNKPGRNKAKRLRGLSSVAG